VKYVDSKYEVEGCVSTILKAVQTSQLWGIVWEQKSLSEMFVLESYGRRQHMDFVNITGVKILKTSVT